MTNQEIDNLTKEYYECLCFNTEHYPKFDQLKDLFYGDGKLIDSNFETPLEFTVQSYAQAMMHQIEEGNAISYSQQEISDVTEVFGRIAQRISVYEYSYEAISGQPWKRGVSYMQFLFNNGSWKIVSTLWIDEKKDLKIPSFYMS